jgi:hypothetical protein
VSARVLAPLPGLAAAGTAVCFLIAIHENPSLFDHF